MTHRRTATARWILLLVVAAAAGLVAGRLTSRGDPGRDEAARLGPTAAAWKVRDAARTRLELRLVDRIASKDTAAARVEANTLIDLDPFHEHARAFLATPDAREAPGKGHDKATVSERSDSGGAPGEGHAEATATERADAAKSPDDARAGAAARSASAYEQARREVRRRVFEAIDGRWPDTAVAAAMRKYAWEGRLEQAAEDLRKLRNDSGEARVLLDGLRIVAAKLEAGRLAWTDGRLAEADAQWQEAFAAERALLPEGVSSLPIREARRQLAQAWYLEGRRHEARDQDDGAMAAWRRGLSADPSDLDLRAALQRAAWRAARR